MADLHSSAPRAPYELFSHQSDFVQRVEELAEPRRAVLVAPTGTGKTTALLACIARLVRGMENPRVLLLAAGPLLGPFQARIRDALDERALVMDAQSYRRLQAQSEPGQNPWLAEHFLLASPDFLARDHRLDEAAAVHWDVVVIDDLHRYRNPSSRSARVGEVLWTSAKVLNVVAATGPGDEFPGFAALHPNTTVLRWTSQGITSALRERLLPSRIVQIIEFDRGEEERRFVELLLAGLAAPASSRLDAFHRALIRRQLESSLAAVELTLRRSSLMAASPGIALQILEAEIAQAEVEEGTAEIEPELAPVENRPTLPFSKDAYDTLFALLEQAEDSKWGACEHLLHGIRDARDAVQPVLLFTEFATTARYLGSLMDMHGWPCAVLDSSLAPSERWHGLDAVRGTSAVLIATSTATEGLDLSFLDHVIHYDLPASRVGFLQRVGRVERMGRTSDAVHHYFFADDILQPPAVIEEYLRTLSESELAGEI